MVLMDMIYGVSRYWWYNQREGDFTWKSKLKMRNKIVLFHTTLRFREDWSWKFVKCSRTRLISSGAETNNWQQVIQLKVGQKCKKKLSHRKFRFRKNKIWKLIKYVHTGQALFPWKRCLKWTNIFASRIISCWWFSRI